jgi:hypothetical protein
MSAELESFLEKLRQRHPSAQVEVQEAESKSGASLARINLGAALYVLEHLPDHGFAVERTADVSLFGASSDVYSSAEEALDKIDELIGVIVYPHATVWIHTEESLEKVTSILSEKFFGGLSFGGKDLRIFDEVPALRLEGNFLGLFVAVHGYPGEYALIIQPRPDTMRGKHGFPMDISNYIALMVQSIADWRVEIPKG